MKTLCFFVLLLIVTSAHAQDCGGMVNAGGTCVPPDVAMPDYQQQAPPPQKWVDSYGAMVSDDSLGKLGVATDDTNEAKAWQDAETDCHAKGGLNCTRLISYRNACAAMVLGDKTYSFSGGSTLADAIKKATIKCTASTSNCHVYYSACSLPVRIQ
jgi:hypothetical protein